MGKKRPKEGRIVLTPEILDKGLDWIVANQKDLIQPEPEVEEKTVVVETQRTTYANSVHLPQQIEIPTYTGVPTQNPLTNQNTQNYQNNPNFQNSPNYQNYQEDYQNNQNIIEIPSSTDRNELRHSHHY